MWVPWVEAVDLIITIITITMMTRTMNDCDYRHLASSVKSLTESVPEESEYFLPGGGHQRILNMDHGDDDDVR